MALEGTWTISACNRSDSAALRAADEEHDAATCGLGAACADSGFTNPEPDLCEDGPPSAMALFELNPDDGALLCSSQEVGVDYDAMRLEEILDEEGNSYLLADAEGQRLRPRTELRKIGPNGTERWRTSLGKEAFWKLKLDGEGNPVLAQSQEGQLDVVRLAGKDGKLLWTAESKLGDGILSEIWALHVRSNSVVVVGSTTAKQLEAECTEHGFVRHISLADGAVSWTFLAPCEQDGITFETVRLDEHDNVIAAGEIHSWDGQGVDSFSNALVVKLSPSGQDLWRTVIKEAPVDAVGRLSLDAEGDIYAAGSGFGSRHLDAFVLKLRGQDGALVWSYPVELPADDYVWGIDATKDRILVVASVQGDLGGPACPGRCPRFEDLTGETCFEKAGFPCASDP